MGKPSQPLLTQQNRDRTANAAMPILAPTVTPRELDEAAIDSIIAKSLAKHLAHLAHPLRTLELTPSASSDVKPITIHDEDRQQLEAMLGGAMISFGADLVRHVKQLCSVQLVSDNRGLATVVLPLDTLQRIESRIPDGVSFQEYVETEISDLFARIVDGSR